MEAKDTLFHINWGDGDDTFVIAPDEKTAKMRMRDGRDMVNYIVRLDSLYQMIFKAGIREVVEWIKSGMTWIDWEWEDSKGMWELYIDEKTWQAKLKECGID